MKAEILCIGDELLIGQVQNTNATEIARQLESIGVEVRRIVAAGDRKDVIQAELKNALAEVELVIVTGGLGPTRDDVTKAAVAEFFGLGMEWNEEAFENCKRLFERRGLKMPESNRSQGEIIAGSVALQNAKGTAPGMILKDVKGYEGKIAILLPGVPYEMEAMLKKSVIPFLAPLSDSFVKHSVIMTAGIGESHLAELINEQEFLTPNTTLAYLPHTMGVRLRVTTRGTNRAQVHDENARVVKMVASRIEPYIFAFDDITLEEIVGKMLLERNLTLATAESCTGGQIANRITNISGASAYFAQSFVVYNNAAKAQTLGVNPETIEAYGAVSEEVALEMLDGCLKRSGADVAVATTGIAGPTGGTETKPVGMVCIATGTSEKFGDLRRVKTYVFSEDRLRNKELFTQTALNAVRKLLLELDSKPTETTTFAQEKDETAASKRLI